MKNQNFKSSRGFTLIELLIVVAIIAILAAIAVPNFLEAQVRAKVSRVKADQRSLATALESYAVDYTAYPPSYVNVTGMAMNTPVTVPNVAKPVGTPLSPGAGGVGRIERMTWITTPIAFITNLPRDPFAPGENDPQQDQENPVFVYWDAPFTDNLKVNTTFLGAPTAAWAQMPTERGNLGSWALISYGPNRLFEVAGGSPLGVYDPTNGTISAGDIWRFNSGVKE